MIENDLLYKCESYLDIMMEETGTETYVIKTELYPKVASILDSPEGQRKFSNLVGDYVSRNTSKLTTIGPMYQTVFNYEEKEKYYKLFEVTEKEIQEIIKTMLSGINDKASWRLIKNNPIFVLFYCVIRYFTINKNAKALNNALVITALAFYPSMFTKYFKYEPNQGVMQYTIDNLSQRFIIKKAKHIFGTLTISIQNSWKFHEKNFQNGSDKNVIAFIQRIRNDQNSLIKKIAQNYNENHKKGLSVYTTTDMIDDNVIVDNENDTNKVGLLTEKIVLQILINGVDLKICNFAANAANVSKIDLRNYLTKIINEKNSNDMKSLIESILFVYLYTEKHQLNEINTKQFISFALALFKKTNSKDKNITNIKSILNKFGTDSGIYERFTRVATRVDYSKAIYLYFIMAIQIHS